MSTIEPSEERTNAAARAMQREDPVPMQMFTFNEICDLARAALIADASALIRARIEALKEAREIAGYGHFREDAQSSGGAVAFHVRVTCGKLEAAITALQADLDKERGNGC